MTLIKSISVIRGTIGGKTGDTLNPLDIVKFTTAYATFIRRSGKSNSGKIVVGRDARISGDMVAKVVCGTLMGFGYDVVNIGLATTPTTELAVRMSGADGGIIITASHNPRHWNALKLLNNEGEFLTKDDGNEVLSIADKEDFDYAEVDNLGQYTEDNTYNKKHIDSVLALKLVDVDAIKAAKFNVCVDSINIESDVKNGDGIDLRAGCHHFRIWNITGNTSDDTVACTALFHSQKQFPFKKYLYPLEPMISIFNGDI